MNKVYEEALPRIPKHKARILELLSMGNCTNVELSKVSMRFGDSIFRLRRDGHIILRDFMGDGVYRYALVGFKDPKEKKSAKVEFYDYLNNSLDCDIRYEKSDILDIIKYGLDINDINLVHRPKY